MEKKFSNELFLIYYSHVSLINKKYNTEEVTPFPAIRFCIKKKLISYLLEQCVTFDDYWYITRRIFVLQSRYKK